MNDVWVLDSSAVLALLQDEPGREFVETLLGQAKISAANAAEVLHKMVLHGETPVRAAETLDFLELTVVAVDGLIAAKSAEYSAARNGLSLGDRMCLATARLENAIAVTADRRWAELDLNVRVRRIR